MVQELLEAKYIYEIGHSCWMSKIFITPVPHQETIYNIMFFKWKLCVNCIQLNQVTLVLVFPIPICDNASMHEFGDGRFHWLIDCPMGYHHIIVNVWL